MMGLAHVALARYDRIAHDTLVAVTSGTPANPTVTAAPGTTPAPAVVGGATPQPRALDRPLELADGSTCYSWAWTSARPTRRSTRTR